MTPSRRLVVRSSAASSIGIALAGFVVESSSLPPHPALLRSATAARFQAPAGTFEVSGIGVATEEFRSNESAGDPTTVPRYVPDAWVSEVRSTRNIERPGSFDGFYDQD